MCSHRPSSIPPRSLPPAETFDTLDDSFAELAQLLQFRDKEQERVKKAAARKEGTLGKDETEMDAWDKEMKVRASASAAVGHIMLSAFEGSNILFRRTTANGSDGITMLSKNSAPISRF